MNDKKGISNALEILDELFVKGDPEIEKAIKEEEAKVEKEQREYDERGMKMNKPIRIEKYGRLVYCNQEMDNTRGDQCLCLNCSKREQCVVAARYFSICRDFGVAFMMTRCPEWVANV